MLWFDSPCVSQRHAVMFENEHPDSIVKLIDFGLSKEYTQKDNILSERVGTLYSMSPETMLGDYTSKADLWSMGVCTYMLLAGGAQPFTGKTPKQMVAKVLVGKYTFDGPYWAAVSEEAKQFIRELLVVKPEERLSATDAKQHIWLVNANENYAREQKGEVDEGFKERVRECIVRYAQSGEFLKLALNVIAKKSSAEDIFELRTVFDEFDQDDTGTLTLNEFKMALGQFKYSEKDIEDIFRKIVGVKFTRWAALFAGCVTHPLYLLFFCFRMSIETTKSITLNFLPLRLRRRAIFRSTD